MAVDLPGSPAAGFAREIHLIRAGGTLDCRGHRWRTALAVVERGCVELVTPAGATLRLAEGAVFTLARLGPVTLRNPTGAPALVTSVHIVRTGVDDD